MSKKKSHRDEKWNTIRHDICASPFLVRKIFHFEDEKEKDFTIQYIKKDNWWGLGLPRVASKVGSTFEFKYRSWELKVKAQ